MTMDTDTSLCYCSFQTNTGHSDRCSDRDQGYRDYLATYVCILMSDVNRIYYVIYIYIYIYTHTHTHTSTDYLQYVQ